MVLMNYPPLPLPPPLQTLLWIVRADRCREGKKETALTRLSRQRLRRLSSTGAYSPSSSHYSRQETALDQNIDYDAFVESWNEDVALEEAQ